MVLHALLLSLVFTFCASGFVYSISHKVPLSGYSLSEKGRLIDGPVALATPLHQFRAETYFVSLAVFLFSIGTFSLATLLSRRPSGLARFVRLLLSLLVIPSALCLLITFQVKHNCYCPGFRRAIAAPFRKFGPYFPFSPDFFTGL